MNEDLKIKKFELNFQTVYATTTITTVFNCYNESNGVAFKWIYSLEEADKGKMRGTTDLGKSSRSADTLV